MNNPWLILEEREIRLIRHMTTLSPVFNAPIITLPHPFIVRESARNSKPDFTRAADQFHDRYISARILSAIRSRITGSGGVTGALRLRQVLARI